jgi:D-threo-aldose 1-dehydrogenase
MTRQKYRPPVDFGLGGVAIGNEFQFVTDDRAEATLAAAWESGVRYYDTSPWYGLGLCERRFGRFLSRQHRSDFVISSKVGKLLTAARDNRAKDYFPFTNSPNNLHYDYSADGVRRSIEDSLQRLGLDRLDMVFVHDLSPDNPWLPGDWKELWKTARDGAFPELTRMREEGLIDGWGMGVNSPEPILKCLAEADCDIHLLARQYSLIDHANAVEEVLPAARAKGVGFVVGSSLNAGFLGGAARFNYGEANTIIDPAVIAKRDKIEQVAREFAVNPVAAALQFSQAPEDVAALIVGTSSPDHILANQAALTEKIPNEFWTALRDQGLIHRNAELPRVAERVEAATEGAAPLPELA